MDQDTKRILYMEDDEGTARLFQKRISKQGFDVDIAGDGPCGLKMVQENDYDLVAVDHSMPGMSGLEVISEMQKDEVSPPIIMVTGAGCERTAAQAMKMGAQDYIVKDVEGVFFELLPSVIHQVFRKQRLAEEKLKAEAALRESESRYRGLVEWSPDGILVVVNGQVTFVNEATCRLLATNFDQMVGSLLMSYVRDCEHKAFSREMEIALGVAPPMIHKFETALVPLEGEIIEVEVAAARIEVEGLPGLQLVLRDITGRKEVESAITQMNEELEYILRDRTAQLEDLHRQMNRLTRNTAMDRKATDVLHNVKNVLNSLVVSTNVMERIIDNSKVDNVGRLSQMLNDHKGDLGNFLTREKKGRMIPEFLSRLARILEKEHHMLHREIHALVDNLDHINVTVTLQQNRAKLSGSVAPIHPTEVLDDALKICRNGFNRHGIEVGRTTDGLKPVQLDRHKVLQILVNLINNAVKAVEDAGRHEDQRRIDIAIRQEDQLLKFAIRDNGVGIPEENMPRLFEYGFTTRKTGHGFGLHGCLALAQDMKATLRAESEGSGKGSTFILTVPVRLP